jgi:hypothetical protein
MWEIVDVGVGVRGQLDYRYAGLPPSISPSVAVDLKAGNRLELRWLTG